MPEENPYLVKVVVSNGTDKGKTFLVDIYDIADSVGARNAAQIQAIKKTLRGGRADKSWKQDMEEAIQSLRRAIEREEALTAECGVKVPDTTTGVPCWGGVSSLPTWTPSASLKVGDRITLNGKEFVVGPDFAIVEEGKLPTFEEWCIDNVNGWDSGDVYRWFDGGDNYLRLPKGVFDKLSAIPEPFSDFRKTSYHHTDDAIDDLRSALIKLGKIRT
jgi:hypothetical protein